MPARIKYSVTTVAIPKSYFFTLMTLGTIVSVLSPVAHAQDQPTIESIEGDKQVVVYTGSVMRPVKVGDEVHYLDVIQTSRRAAAKVRYPDGSTLVVGRDTKLEIQPLIAGTQYNELYYGQIRAQVEKSKKPDPKAPPRFVIRTRTAVMGVRGTDFVAAFDSASQETALHTINGVVDFGTDESKVMSWQGTPVSAGHEASLGSGLEVPKVATFAPVAYEKEIKAEQPELVALASPPKPDASVSTAANPSPPPPVAPTEPWFSILSFRLGAVSIVQNSKIAFTTGMIAWDPTLKLITGLGLRGQVSVFGIKNGTTGATFPVIKTGGLLDLNPQLFGPIHLEGGAGLENWLTDSQGKLSTSYLSGNVSWHFGAGHWLENLYVGASMLLAQGGSSNPIEALAGAGVRF